MKGLHDFIIKLDYEFNDSFLTESGERIYADVRFSADRLSNRIADVMELPLKFKDCEIKKGYQVMVDPTILYQQHNATLGYIENNFMIDRKNGIYKISPDLIVMYRKNENSEWIGYGENFLATMETEVIPEKTIGLIIVESEKTEVSRIYARVVYPNEKLISEGVGKGDKILIEPDLGVAFWIDGKPHFWFQNRYVIAKMN